MKYANYRYKTQVTFSFPIHSHFFLLRCTPSNNSFQQVINETCEIYPNFGSLSRSIDGFGNIVHSGLIKEPHNYFEIKTSGGIKLQETYALHDEQPNRLFLYESFFTKPDDNIANLLKNTALAGENSVSEMVLKLSWAVYDTIEYTQGTTDINTTASDALKLGKGVCQDFAHLLISLCRLKGIPSRYVTGFMEGEGHTHAWVEYYDSGYWKAADPTQRKLVETGYIKLSHGRDYEDCSIERGVFSGRAEQNLEVFLNVGMRDYSE